MATCLSHNLLRIYCHSTPQTPTFPSIRRNPNPNTRLLPVRKLSQRENSNPSSKENSIPESEPLVLQKKPNNPNISFSSSFFESVSGFLIRIRNEWKTDDLGPEILSIALPSVLALAADPIASLVDSAFVGHLGSVELAAVGVSISVFNLVSKLFNIPLLNITTSFVAEHLALVRDDNNDSLPDRKSDSGFGPVSLSQESPGDKECKKLFLPAVSASLALAAGIGVAEAVALYVGPGFLMNIMGIAVDSPMRLPSEHFLALRAFGAPPIVIALAAQGTFRGFMDTKTPLFAVVTGNLLNAILDPILIFFCGLGIGGAAISTVISEYVIAFILLWELNEKVILVPPNIDGGLLISRTVAVLVTMTLATSMAAQQGPIAMAGHQICLEVWLAVSLLTDALALAGQALLASFYGQQNYKRARDVIYKILQIGIITGIALAVILFLGFGAFCGLFSTDSAVLEIALSGILFVAGSQPMNALAFVFDGLYYGVSDFAYAAYSMMLVSLISSLFLLVVVPIFGLAGVWTGLFLFMSLRVLAGVWRLSSKDGPWKMVWSEMEMEMVDK
ncbi:MATE efflux family protein isoform X2 [Tasmannia lanceolata]|uniref:MATE efflux family protein isoform X2 n=1 Tax=Tasmannia lanceolata TaxID=3420 RepID=UPI004063F296